MTRQSVEGWLDRPRQGVPAALFFGGIASLLRGVDTNWDLRNYHFYDPWAWLNDRMYWDYAPAQIQSYHSPLLDLPFYALVRAELPAFAITFLMGVPFGLAVYFFYRITRYATVALAPRREPIVLLAIGLVALTGAAGFSQIGSTMNEWATAALVMAALFALVRTIGADGTVLVRAAALAGLLCGIAAGLKLTAAIYGIALFASFVLCFRGRPGFARAALALAAAMAAGFVAAYGYWGVVLWERFRNPFFPYFNGLFQSEYWEPRSFFDTKFRPPTFVRWLTLPFGLAGRNRLASEAELRDPRLALLGVVAVFFAVSLVRQSRVAGETVLRSFRRRMPPILRLLAVFAGASYVAWLLTFTIYRYAIPLELVASLLLVVALRSMLAGFARRDALLAAVSLLIVAATVMPYWGRARLHAGRYIEVTVPPIAGDSLVLMMTGEPFGYIVPFIESGARVIAPSSNFTGPAYGNRLQREMAALIAGQQGPMYAIRYLDRVDAGEEATMAAYGLRRADDECRTIRSNLEGTRPLGLCRLLRVGRQGGR
jgi:hypothetical protein